MKRISFLLLVAAFVLFSCFASATDASVVGGEFTDVSTSTTEDTVVRFEAILPDQNAAYNLQVLTPDQLTVDTNIDFFKFVVEGGNPPARFFPAETQRQINEILGEGVADSLYMTEFMRMHAAPMDTASSVDVSMVVNVEYHPRETVIVVLGDVSDPENMVWTALPAEVTALCQIEFTIPADVLASFQGEDLIYTLLTTTASKALYRTEEREVHTTVVIPSIGIEDVVEIINVTTDIGDSLARNFRLVIVKETEFQIEELNDMRTHVMQQNRSLLSWFPAQVQNEIDMLLDDSVDLDRLVIYDYLPLYTSDYQDTYGDVLVTFAFATPYQEGDKIVTVLGLPQTDAAAAGTQMEWHTQIARVSGNGMVEITFGQYQLLQMMEEPGLLMLLVERRIP